MSEYEHADEVESGESLLAVLDEITVLVENAKSVPLSSSILLNRHELLELLNTAAQMLPSELVEAHNMLQEQAKVSNQARDKADRVIAEAREQAKHIIAQAKAQAQRMVSRDSVTVKARQQAAQIVDEAKSKAAKISAGANQYSDATLAEVASQLAAVQEYVDQIQVQIDAGRDVLAQRQAAEAENVAERDAVDREAALQQEASQRQIREAARENKAAEKAGSAADRGEKLDSEFSDAQLDFATVQAAFAQMEADGANGDFVRVADVATENVQGGEIPAASPVTDPEAESYSTAQTAPSTAEDEYFSPASITSAKEFAEDSAAQASSVQNSSAQNLSGTVLPEQLPADFDEFVPELEFDDYGDEYRK